MQGRGGGRDPFDDFGDPFAGFGGFGSFGGHRSLLSNFMGGRNPFDDPFFTRPFGGGMFESGLFGPSGSPFVNTMQPSAFIGHEASAEPKRSRGPIIEELDSDDENKEGKDEKRDNPRKHGRSSKGPYVEEPDVTGARKSNQLQYGTEYGGFNAMGSQSQARSLTFQSSSVTYGGANGACYTSSKMRRTGSDGVTIEESKEADTATGQAAHNIFRGLQNKGHSVSRKLGSDGKVDTMQTLHNINEDELARFEKAWKGNVKHLPGWNGSIAGHNNLGAGSSAQSARPSQGGWALPSTEDPYHTGRLTPNATDRAGPSRSQNSGRMRSSSDVRDKSSHSRWIARG